MRRKHWSCWTKWTTVEATTTTRRRGKLGSATTNPILWMHNLKKSRKRRTVRFHLALSYNLTKKVIFFVSKKPKSLLNWFYLYFKSKLTWIVCTMLTCHTIKFSLPNCYTQSLGSYGPKWGTPIFIYFSFYYLKIFGL